MIYATYHVHAALQFEQRDQFLEVAATRAFSNNRQLHVWLMKPVGKYADGFDHEIEALIVGQVADGKDSFSIWQTQLPARLFLDHRVEFRRVHSIGNSRYLRFGDSKLNDRVVQRLAYGHHPVRLAQNILQKPPDHRKCAQKIDIASSGRYDDGFLENRPQ